jgi:hypothetical protein
MLRDHPHPRKRGLQELFQMSAILNLPDECFDMSVGQHRSSPRAVKKRMSAYQNSREGRCFAGL